MMKKFLLLLIVIAGVQPLFGQVNGQVTEKLICETNSDHAYSLYLPKAYTTDKKWPVLFIYDAQGNGLVGIDKFKPAAEKFGLLLVGSYNYRNGPVDRGFEAASVLLEEITTKYSADPDRLYTAGMSGGARMATTVAVVTGRIAGVVAIGAAFNFMNEPNANSKFDLVGISGDKDMNFSEMPFATELIRSIGNYGHYISYDGKHRWCEAKQATEAMAWLELMAIRQGKVKHNSSFSEKLLTEMEQKADSLEQAGNLTEAHRNLESLSLIAEEPRSKLYQARMKALSNAKAYKKQRKLVDRVMAKERQKEIELRKGFKQIEQVVKSDSIYAWWQKQTQKLRQEQKSAKSLVARNAATRNLGLIGLYAFTTASSHLFAGDWNKALPYYKVATLINPDHADVNYFMAKLYALAGDTRLSKRHLKKATNAGFRYPDSNEAITNDRLKDPNEFKWLSWRVLNATF